MTVDKSRKNNFSKQALGRERNTSLFTSAEETRFDYRYFDLVTITEDYSKKVTDITLARKLVKNGRIKMNTIQLYYANDYGYSSNSQILVCRGEYESDSGIKHSLVVIFDNKRILYAECDVPSYGVKFGISKEILARRGLLSCVDYYLN